MADKKISELDAITGANTAATDAFVVVDTSTGETKKITREELNNAIEQDVLSTVDINGGTIDGTTIGGSTPAAGTFTTVNASGAVIVGGDLTVNGTTTTINSTTLTVDDKNIELASGAADAAAANGAGITIDGASATFNYASTGDKWTFNKPIDVTGNIIVSGTVDGRDVAADGTKLDGIEASATADQTAAEIRTLVDSATDSNVFTDADHTKLDGIEAGATADQDAAEIRALVDSATDSNVFTDADHTKLDGIATGATNVSALTDLSISDGTNGQVLTTNGSGTFTFSDVSASDAQTLDGLDSTAFLRSNADDTASGDITFSGMVTVSATGYPILRLRPSGSSNPARIQFGVSGDEDHGQINYLNSTSTMTFRANNTDIMDVTGTSVSLNKQLDMNNNDIYGVDQIFHEGDTNTYIQFHASDQFRVVTGGSERFEVNSAGCKGNGIAAKWARFEQIGTHGTAGTKGVSSLTDEGTGKTRINFSGNFSNTSYCCPAAAADSTSGSARRAMPGDGGQLFTSSIRICVDNNGSTNSDAEYVHASMHHAYGP